MRTNSIEYVTSKKSRGRGGAGNPRGFPLRLGVSRQTRRSRPSDRHLLGRDERKFLLEKHCSWDLAMVVYINFASTKNWCSNSLVNCDYSHFPCGLQLCTYCSCAYS